MKKVFLVDDNRFVVRVAKLYFDRYGWELEVCDGPFGALNKIKEYKPDFVLIDLVMPGLNGSSLAALLKGLRAKEPFKLISFSSETEDIQKKLVEDGLVDAYFIKSNTLYGLKNLMESI